MQEEQSCCSGVDLNISLRFRSSVFAQILSQPVNLSEVRVILRCGAACGTENPHLEYIWSLRRLTQLPIICSNYYQRNPRNEFCSGLENVSAYFSKCWYKILAPVRALLCCFQVELRTGATAFSSEFSKVVSPGKFIPSVFFRLLYAVQCSRMAAASFEM